MNAQLLFLHALSPLHAGTGQGVGAIDLPIARERATNLPFVPGSTIKGVLRDNSKDESLQIKIFGPKTDKADEHAGSAQFADARLLLFPVRSLLGTFAWVTSPYVLQRFVRDLNDVGITNHPALPTSLEKEEHCIVSKSSVLRHGTNIYLEDLDLTVQDESAQAWGEWLAQRIFAADTDWQNRLIERFCIVHDNVLNFLLETATEITARIKLQANAKTVEEGGLWYEESLPTESILSGLVLATPTKKAEITPEQIFTELHEFNGKILQVGGKATVGRGLVRLHIGN